jgi:molybdate transport system permease protein
MNPTPSEWTSVILSLEVALLATLINLPLAIGMSWLLSRTRFFGRRALDLVVHAPLVLPPVVVGYLLLIVFGTRGLIGHWLLATTGIRLAFTFQGAVLAAAAMSFPLMVRSMRLSLDTMDHGLELAARTLGASRRDVFLSVTAPLMLPGIIAGSIVGLARALGEFGATITFAGNIEGETRTIPVAIYTATATVGGDQSAMRLAAISLILSFVALYLAGWLEARVRVALGYSRPSDVA